LIVSGYVHGYSERESQRLHDQAGSVRELFHHDTAYPAGSTVLEVACGVGAQTVTLARNSPDANFTSFDISPESLKKAHALVRQANVRNVNLHRANLFSPPFRSQSFDHLFVCHVVEHLAEPVAALACLRELLGSDGSITVIEGDHGSCYFHPESDESLRAWNCLIEVQAQLGGNSLVGRELYPLLVKAGFRDVQVSPRMVYSDESRPAMMDAFVNKTIIPMVVGVRTQALEMGLIDAVSFDKGIQDLYDLAASKEGSFCYTFFKGTGRR
jgi:ubiquinone/menaquinone biosynthesis C-methylase UbiE